MTTTAYTLSGEITDTGGTPIQNIAVNIYLWNGAQWSDQNANVTTDTNGKYTYAANPGGKYKIEPDGSTYAFEPEFIVTRARRDKPNLDFEGTTLGDASAPNDAVDREFMKALLLSCYLSIDIWIDTKGVQQTRKFLISLIAAGLKKSGDAPLTQREEKLTAVKCSVCWNRFYTPGTIYYLNRTLLTDCLCDPPCSP